MIVLIALLVGIDDIAALIALAGVNASMIVFGWMQERYQAPGASMQPFWIGCVAGAVPWIAIDIYLAGPGVDLHPPGFVYGVSFSMFALGCLSSANVLRAPPLGARRPTLHPASTGDQPRRHAEGVN